MEGPPEALFKARTARENHTPVRVKNPTWGENRGAWVRGRRETRHTPNGPLRTATVGAELRLSFLRRAQSIELAREHLGIDRAQVAGHLRGSEPVYVAHFDGAGDAARVGDD